LIVVFLAVVLFITAAIHFYLWKRLVRDTTAPGRGRRAGTILMITAVTLLVAGLFGGRLIEPGASRWIAWPGYLWLATMFYLLVILLALELPRLVLNLTWARRSARTGTPVGVGPAGPLGSDVPADSAGRPAGADGRPAGADGAAEADAPAGADGPPAGPTRRLVLARTLALAAGITAVSTVGYGVSQAIGPPRLDRVRIPLAKLPRRHDGLRIALVSDIHLGPLLGRAHTQRIVDMINGTDPDLVAVVGDLVDGSVDELGAAAAPLAQLRSRYGGFFVTGNHEYFSGYEQWVDELGELGLRVLQNERVEIDGLDLAGVNDVTGGQYDHGPDFAATLDGRDPSRPVVLLAHQPVQVREAAKYGVDLQLSGHTHGGQMQPFGVVVRAQQPLLSGLATIDGTRVYVTNGAGFWGPPVRVGAPPQVSVVELRAQ
jgi:predicted MPP superfamily phosphohydrolase